ncbi:hypothetical protein [Halobacteriovorax sp.]|uniref:hypothetical protein n=1 Tax=Halobacteriovorax sp. TaxID=2020862 RepID=UPI003AF29B40
MKVVLFFIFVSIITSHIKANEFTHDCREVVEKRLSKMNQYRFRKQCEQITSSYQLNCITDVLNMRRAISLVEFNACTYVKSSVGLEAVREITSYYNSQVNSLHVTLAALVKNRGEKACLSHIVHHEGITPLNVYNCFENRKIDSLRTFAQMYIK